MAATAERGGNEAHTGAQPALFPPTQRLQPPADSLLQRARQITIKLILPTLQELMYKLSCHNREVVTRRWLY